MTLSQMVSLMWLARWSLSVSVLLHAVCGEDKHWLVVCASGITCGGKSTVMEMLHRRLNGSVLLHQDDYYLADDDPRHVQLPALRWRNRELMSSLDMARMRNDIDQVLCRRDTVIPVLLLDGFMLYYDKYITGLCDLKFFFLLSKDTCKLRRKRRNRTIPDIEAYFEQYVWPAYLNYREMAFQENPDAILINGEDNNETIVDDISFRIYQRLQAKNL